MLRKHGMRGESPTDEPKLGLEKILPTSAGDYVESIGRKLSDYVFIRYSHTLSPNDINKARLVPDGTEVIVDYRIIHLSSNGSLYSHNQFYEYGTALIPKQKV
jgi:hypothetical protein